VERGYTPDKGNGAFSKNAVSNLPFEVSKPVFLQQQAYRFIEKHQRDPFLLVVSYVEPHSPYNGPFNDEHSLAEIERCINGAPGADIPLRYKLMREWQQEEARLDRDRLPIPYFSGTAPEEYRGIRQRYFGLITMVDRSIGGVLACLERTGLIDDPIIVLTSDHGDMLGDHHLFGKEVMYEQATRIPCLIRQPGRQRQLRITQPTSHIGFLPTLFDLLNLAVPVQCQGQSKAPLLRGESMAPESIFMQWSPNRIKVLKGTRLAKRSAVKRAINESTRTVVLPDGWKLCLRDKDINELYHLQKDPTEQHNLYYNQSYEEIVKRGTGEIHRWQEKVSDRVKV
jgi:arylsulfatase A-like enzyme